MKITKEQLIYDELLNYLSDKYDYVTSTQILKVFPEIKNGANLREMINILRTNGYLIISSSKGYKLSDNVYEVFSTIRALEHRAASIIRAAQGMLNVI